jgi:translocation and assembly module TamA
LPEERLVAAAGLRRYFRRRGVWALVLALCMLPLLGFADESVQLEGVSGHLKDNLDAYLGKLSDEDMQNWQATQSRLRNTARDAMESVGYYQAAFTLVRAGRKVTLTVLPGAPVRVRQLVLRFQGEAAHDEAFADLQKKLPMETGDIFNHGSYEGLKTRIQNTALERGYFDGEWSVHKAAVDIAAHAVDVDLEYDSGSRYRFGATTFAPVDPQKPLKVKEKVMTSLVPFATGDPYEAAKVIKLNKTLLDSRFFSDVRVRAEPDHVLKEVPVMVSASTAKPNNVDTGIGYSTDVGARISLDWRRSLLNQSGHSIEMSTQLSQVGRAFETKYTIPLTHPIDDTLQLLYGVNRQDIDTVRSYSTTVGVQRQINRDTGWQQVQSLRFTKESFDFGDISGNSDKLMPGLTLSRTRTKGGSIDPYWGDRQFYQLQVATAHVLSDSNVIYLRLGFRFLRTFDDVNQILLRADGGAVFTDEFDSLPPTLRFFAGGDQSVRGYDYQTLAPRDDAGFVVGGRYMGTGSVEYGRLFLPHWRAATFVDAGNAFDSIKARPKVGTGFGVRWISPVGAIRLDLAWALSADHGVPWRLHFSMGSAL